MSGIEDILAYALALGIAAAIPGPGITALVARSVGSGAAAGFAMLAGLIIGDLAYLSFAVFGLALMAQHFHALFIVIRALSVVFLLYLAWQFWHSQHQPLSPKPITGRTLLSSLASGLGVTLGNPKTIAFYLAILPLVINMQNVGVKSWASILVPVTVMVLLIVGGAYILGAVAIRRWLTSAAAQRRMHRGAALAMAAAAGSLMLKSADQ